MPASRKLPRPFELHWGSGVVAEEASAVDEHHEGTIQLLEFTDGPAAGTTSLRFCYYDLQGRFQRGPLIVSEENVEGLRAALERAPKLRALLKRLVD